MQEDDLSTFKEFSSRVSSWDSKYGSDDDGPGHGRFTKNLKGHDGDKDDLLGEFGFSEVKFHDVKEGEDKDDKEAESDLRQQVHALKSKLTNLNVEKQVAEERADRAMEKVVELKKLLDSDLAEADKDSSSAGSDVDKLKRENRMLQEKLRDTQSHIFSLQPYRKDLTAEEVGKVSMIPPFS